MSTTVVQRCRELAFRSSYRGEANYTVYGGPMHGRIVRVLFAPEEILREDFASGAYNYTAEEFEVQVIGRRGLILASIEAVTPDVLEVYKREHNPNAQTGRWTGEKWEVTP